MPSLSFSSRRGQIALFLVVVGLYWASLYTYVPTLSGYARTKVNDLAMVGLIISMYGLWQAIIRLPLGIASDWLGRRKPFILACFVLAASGALVMAWASDAGGLLVGRALTGVAAGAWVPLVVAFSALFPPDEAVRASAILSAVNALSRMVATGMTGVLNLWGGYRLAFYVAAGIAGAAILALAPMPETLRSAQLPSAKGLAQLALRRDVLLPSLLCAVLQYALWSATFSFTPILSQQLGAGDTAQSLMVTMNIGLVFLCGLLTPAALRRFQVRYLVAFGFVATVLGLGVLALAPSLIWVWVGQCILGLGGGVGYPVLMGMSIRHVDHSRRATAMGIFQSLYGVGMFAGPWLSGILADAIGIQPMFGVTGAATLLLAGMGLGVLVNAKKREA
ncbi:MAG: MFS transporter [Anaerolineae bacterium]|nr:MFS transporter [Anaerolineae bacterium]